MSKNTANRNVPRLRPLNFQPAADVTEWISSAGVTTISETSRIERVISRAALLAAGFKMLEISQKMSSAKTVDSAIVVANVQAAARSSVNLVHDLATDEMFGVDLFELKSGLSSTRPLPERIGNSFRHAKTATIRNVRMKGSKENVKAGRRLRRRWAGTALLRSSAISSIGRKRGHGNLNGARRCLNPRVGGFKVRHKKLYHMTSSIYEPFN